MITNVVDMLKHARENGYAVCSPNISTIDEGRQVIEAAQELGAPALIDMAFVRAPRYTIESRRWVANFIQALEPYALAAKIPVAFQQDHGPNFASSIACISAGFTSLMVDRSELPFEDNIAQVAELVKIAHACGVSVEGELGHVGHGDNYAVDGVSNFTEPDKAAEFVERTGIDSLAIAIGTAHGKYVGTPKLHFEILEACKKAVSVPLVLHGGSFSGDDQLEYAAKHGFAKINIATELGDAGRAKVAEKLEEGGGELEAPRFYREFYLQGFKEKYMHYLRLFGTAGRY